MFRAALKSALALKLKENQLNVVEAFELESHKTKAFSQALARLGFDRKVLVIDHQQNPNLRLAARNLSDVQLLPNLQVTPYHISLRDRSHRFLRGHRIMVQIQSTWFPIIDRNPQTFVPNIFRAQAADFRRATQRVYLSREFPSYLSLPVRR